MYEALNAKPATNAVTINVPILTAKEIPARP
jgi:hypothetical protein